MSSALLSRPGWRRIEGDPVDELRSRIEALESGGASGGYADYVNARDGFPTLQAAADAAKAASLGLYIPAGTYTPSSTPSFVGALDISGLTVIGAGQASTYLTLADAAYKDTNMVLIKSPVTLLADLTLTGPDTARTDASAAETGPDSKDKGIGVYVYGAAVDLYDISLIRVGVQKTGGWSCKMTADSGKGLFNNTMFDCRLHTAKASGGLFYGGAGVGATTLLCLGCNINGPGYSTHGKDAGKADCTRGAIHLENAVNCSFIGRCVSQSPNNETNVSMSGGGAHGFHDFYIENAIGSDSHQYVITASGFMAPCLFDNLYLVQLRTTRGPRVLKVGATSSGVSNWKFKDGYWDAREATVATDDLDLSTAADTVILDNVTLLSAAAAAYRDVSRAAAGTYRFTGGDGGGELHTGGAGTRLTARGGSVTTVAYP